MGWAKELAARAVKAGGRAVVDGAKKAAGPKVVKTTKGPKTRGLPDVIGDLQRRASGGNHRKAMALYNEVGQVIDAIQGAGSPHETTMKRLSQAVKLVAKFGTHRFELDERYRQLGTVLKVKSGDESTRALAGMLLSQLVDMGTSPVTNVLMSPDGKQLLVVLGALEL